MSSRTTVLHKTYLLKKKCRLRHSFSINRNTIRRSASKHQKTQPIILLLKTEQKIIKNVDCVETYSNVTR